MKDYWKHVGSYLTGWLIARATFERVWQHFMRDSENGARQVYIRDQAVAFVDELESRRKSDEEHRLSPDTYLITEHTARVLLHHVMGDSHLHSADELDAAIKSLQTITGDR